MRQNTDSTRTTQIAELLVSLLQPDAGVFQPGTVIVCTAKSASDIHPLLSQKHVFSSTIALRGISKDGRKEVLADLVRAKVAGAELLQLDEDDAVNFLRVATETEGFLVSDLKDLVDRAIQQAAIRCSALAGPPVRNHHRAASYAEALLTSFIDRSS